MSSKPAKVVARGLGFMSSKPAKVVARGLGFMSSKPAKVVARLGVTPGCVVDTLPCDQRDVSIPDSRSPLLSRNSVRWNPANSYV